MITVHWAVLVGVAVAGFVACFVWQNQKQSTSMTDFEREFKSRYPRR